jgi:hypothetical protein
LFFCKYNVEVDLNTQTVYHVYHNITHVYGMYHLYIYIYIMTYIYIYIKIVHISHKP